MKQFLIYRERLNKTSVVQLLSKLVPMHLVLSLALLFSLVSGASAFYLASSTKQQPDSGIEQKIITAYKADPLAFAEFFNIISHTGENKNNLSVQFIELLKSSALDPNLAEDMPIEMARNYVPTAQVADTPLGGSLVDEQMSQQTCFELPYAENYHLKSVSDLPGDFGVRQAKLDVKEVVTLYAVTVEPKYARDIKTLERLDQARLKGYYLISQAGSLRGHLSIGVFSQRDLAEKLMNTLKKHNVKGAGIRPKETQKIASMIVTVSLNRAKEFERFSQQSLKLKAQPCSPGVST